MEADWESELERISQALGLLQSTLLQSPALQMNKLFSSDAPPINSAMSRTDRPGAADAETT